MINRESELAQEFWEKGRLPDCPILDFHGHMGNLGQGFLPKGTTEAMLDTMDRCNTLFTFFCGHEALMNPCWGEETDMEAVRKFPDRFKAYHFIPSRYPKPEEDLKRMDAHRDIFAGFKIHCDIYRVALSDPRHDAYWDYANRHRLPVLSHTWGGSPYDGASEVEKILSSYPDLIFIAGHAIHGDWQRGTELAAKYPNMYLELTAVLDDRGALDLFVERIGSRQILFGTDLPWFSTHHGIGAVLSAEMTDADRRNILYKNGARILKDDPWFQNLWAARGTGEPLDTL